MKLSLPILLFMLILFSGCKKDEDVAITIVTTNQVTNISSTSAVFNGKVAILGKATSISDHGFIYSATPSLPASSSTKLSLGPATGSKAFSTTVTDLLASQKYYLKAFAQVGSQFYYGEILSFSLLSPSISSFEPQTLTMGDTLTIKGNNFTSHISAITIRIQDVDLKPIVATDTLLKVIISENMIAGISKIKLVIGAGETISDQQVTILPLLTSVSPLKGTSNTNVTLSGKGFSIHSTGNVVTFNDIIVPVSSSTNNSLSIILPESLDAGNYLVSLRVNGVKATSKFDFKVPGWKKVSTASFRRSGAFSFVVGNKLYIGAGIDFTSINGEAFDDFWSYDVSSNTWMKLADFPGGKLIGAVSFAIHGKGYVGLGFKSGNGPVTDFWEYNPVNNGWRKIADFPGIPRNSAASFTINNKGYVGSGNAYGTTDLADFYEYDPSSDQWSGIADYGGGPAYGLTSFTISNKAYMVAGTVNSDQRIKQCWQYDPDLNQWQQKADFPDAARLEGIGFSINNKGYFGLGSITNNDAGSDMWEYDPLANTWKQQPVFIGNARFAGVWSSMATFGIFGMGIKGNVTYDDIWLFFPD